MRGNLARIASRRRCEDIGEKSRPARRLIRTLHRRRQDAWKIARRMKKMLYGAGLTRWRARVVVVDKPQQRHHRILTDVTSSTIEMRDGRRVASAPLPSPAAKR